MIALRNLSVAAGGRAILHDITLSLAPGEFLALCGPNGAGKSTLLRALAGIGAKPAPDPRQVAYVEQGARAAWPMTIGEVAALGRIPHRDRNEAAIGGALARCGVLHMRDRRIDQVSGGQARRAMLSRALATEPAVLLLDEPVADLDPAAAHEIMHLLAGIARAGGTVVAVLHALDLARHYASRMVVLAAGRIVADAPPDAALPHAAAAFGMTVIERTVPVLEPMPPACPPMPPAAPPP